MYNTLLQVDIEANYDGSTVHSVDIKIGPQIYLDKNAHLTINKDGYTPQIGDKLYFMPGVNIPRIKLKDLAINYNIKVVRDADEADVIFAGDSTFHKMSNYTWKNTLKTEDLKNFIQACVPKLGSLDYLNLTNTLVAYKEPTVVMNYRAARIIGDAGFPLYQNFQQNPGTIADRNRDSIHVLELLNEYKDLYDVVSSKVLIHESCLLDKLNGNDAVIINEEVFEQISSMFKSSDADNHVLAMEIMSNCNYTESLLYLEMLFHEYYNTMRSNNARTHVNFRSLLSYLQKDKNYFSTSIDEMIRSLLKKKVLTVDMVNIILSKYSDQVDHGTECFKVKTLTLNEEYLKFLNSNYLYEIQKNFVPEIIQVVEEVETVSEVKWL
jgi:hypothetical protein